MLTTIIERVSVVRTENSTALTLRYPFALLAPWLPSTQTTVRTQVSASRLYPMLPRMCDFFAKLLSVCWGIRSDNGTALAQSHNSSVSSNRRSLLSTVGARLIRPRNLSNSPLALFPTAAVGSWKSQQATSACLNGATIMKKIRIKL